MDEAIDVLAGLLAAPIEHVYAALWRAGVLTVEESR
jgi:hypothetical protein